MKLASAARLGVRAGPSGDAPPAGFWWIAVIGLLLVSCDFGMVGRDFELRGGGRDFKPWDRGCDSPDEASEVPRHPGGVRHEAGDQLEGSGGLVHGHVPAVERAAADA